MRHVVKQICKCLRPGQTVSVVINVLEEEGQLAIKVSAKRVPGIKKAWTAKQIGEGYRPLREGSGTEPAIKEYKWDVYREPWAALPSPV